MSNRQSEQDKPEQCPDCGGTGEQKTIKFGMIVDCPTCNGTGVAPQQPQDETTGELCDCGCHFSDFAYRGGVGCSLCGHNHPTPPEANTEQPEKCRCIVGNMLNPSPLCPYHGTGERCWCDRIGLTSQQDEPTAEYCDCPPGSNTNIPHFHHPKPTAPTAEFNSDEANSTLQPESEIAHPALDIMEDPKAMRIVSERADKRQADVLAAYNVKQARDEIDDDCLPAADRYAGEAVKQYEANLITNFEADLERVAREARIEELQSVYQKTGQIEVLSDTKWSLMARIAELQAEESKEKGTQPRVEQ